MTRELFQVSDPRQPFYVINHVDVTPAKQRVLTRLYQPLIGAQAQALYLTLAFEYNALPLNSDYQSLVQLQEQTGQSLKAIFDSLHKLEAVSLVTTYTSENQVLGRVLKFKLGEILSAQAFFDEFLLASLLKEKVGEESFKRLKTDFQTSIIKVGDHDQDVSASFFDVFHLSQADLANLPAAQPQPKPQSVLKAKTPVDWQELSDLLARYHLPVGTVDSHRQQIQQVMGFYHYTEEQFADLVASTLIPGQEKLDFQKIENAASSQAQNKQAQDLRQRLTKQKSAEQVINNLGKQDQALLKQALTLPPLEFLTRCKRGKGGYVAAQERRVIFNLQNRTGLTPELVNMVAYVALRYDSILTQQRADRIANSWLENGVTTAAGAISFVKQYDQKTKTRHSRRYGQPKRVEQGTDWSKKKAKQDSDLSMADLRKMLGGKDDAGNQ
jgi:replication initiation and membrane attachment protein